MQGRVNTSVYLKFVRQTTVHEGLQVIQQQQAKPCPGLTQFLH